MPGRRWRFTGSPMKTRVVLFGEKLDISNHESKLWTWNVETFQWSWPLLAYIPTFWCAVPEIGNDFAVDLSRFEKWFLEALGHSPLGKKEHVVPCRKQCRQNWTGTRRGVGKENGTPRASVGCKLCDHQTSTTTNDVAIFASVSRLAIIWRGSFLECPFKFKMVKRKPLMNAKFGWWDSFVRYSDIHTSWLRSWVAQVF